MGAISFDLSSFTSGRPFSDLVVSIKNGSKDPTPRFEPVLRTVRFPELGNAARTNSNGTARDGDEVAGVLQWIRDQKVDQILSLRVLDRLHGPHQEDIIGKWTSDFSINELNWRRLDLSIYALCKDGEGTLRPNITALNTVHLYSSGNIGVIEHWFGTEGLKQLPSVSGSSSSDMSI